MGTFQAVIDGAAPWQNGKTERHGSWLKTRLEEELQSGQTIVRSSIELETLAQLVTSHKNRWFHRGGYSPYQLVFGVNPRVPLELLSDDHMIIAGADDAGVDPFEADGPAAEFARAHAIRQRARELCIASNLKDRVRLSLSHNMHQQKQWAPNQCVYVWRKFPGTGGGHTTRARWIGPGLVIMQQGNTVWVSMRARIWKCSSDQLRSASHLETLGAELTKAQGLEDILNQTKSKQAGAVDVAAEGPPERDAWSQPAVPEGEASPALPDVGVLQQQQESTIEQARLPALPEDEAINIGHGMIRQILPQPIVGDSPGARELARTFPRQHSQATQEEPNVEPVPSDASDSTDSSKRRKTITGPPEPQVEVRQRVADLESKRLEREALRFLKRLDREERQQSRGSAASSSSAALPSSAAQPVSGPSTTPVDLEESAPIPDDQDDDLLSFFDVCPSKEDILEKGSLPFCEMSISQDSERPSFLAKPTKAKNSEFDMKQATPEEIKGFEASDLKEWEAILSMGSVRVLSKEESLKVIANSPERVITSRMIRRKKPVPGVGNFKFKSRWCLHGHQDPDSMSGSFQVFSPMPSCESITLFFQIAINEQLLVCFLDIQNAFCQADRLDRPQGKLYAVPCSGLKIPKERLIEIIAPIYGLDDSPLRWHRTLINFFQGLGFEKSLLEPCWLVKRVRGKIVAQILIEVDDLNVAATPEYLDTLQTALKARFIFGKWEEGTADFAGRHVSVRPDKVIMHQEKYILEKLHPVRLAKGRLSDRASELSHEEFEDFRSMLYKVNWVAHQTRPEAAGIVSILASRLKNATVHDVSCLNKLISHLRGTASQPSVLHKFNNRDMVFIAASDAGGVDGKPIGELDNLQDTVQGAWIILCADRVPSASSKTKVSILSWRSAKLKRRVTSTLASEALAFSQALGELEWLQVMFMDIVHGNINREDWTESVLPFIGVLKDSSQLRTHIHEDMQEQCTITDAKSLFDSLKKENPTSRQDRRTSIEIAIIIESMQRSKSVLRWSPHPRMIADVLTKDDIGKSNGALEELLRTGTLALWDEEDELARRRENPRSKARSKRAARQFRADSSGLLGEGQLNNLMNHVSSYFTRSDHEHASISNLS